MREAVGFPCGAITVERKDGALSNEMRRGIVPVQVREDWSERLARMQLLGRLRFFGVHVHHEMGVCGEQSHLAFRIPTIGAVGVGLDELPDGKAIPGFLGEDAKVFAISRPPRLPHLGRQELFENCPRFEKRFDAVRAEFAANAGVLESAERRLLIVKHAVD